MCVGGGGGPLIPAVLPEIPTRSSLRGIIQVFARQAGGDETLSGVRLFLKVTELFVDSWP